jgi:hypothetical protein
MLVKLLTLELYVISSFLPRFRQRHSLLLELCKKLIVILVHCLAWSVWSAITPLKYSIGFSHKCECFVWTFFLSLLGTVNWFASFSPQTTHLGRAAFLKMKWIRSRNTLHYIGGTTILEMALTLLCVIIRELVPATLDSFSSSDLRFFNYESIHTQ